jgi:hypothetical protein
VPTFSLWIDKDDLLLLLDGNADVTVGGVDLFDEDELDELEELDELDVDELDDLDELDELGELDIVDRPSSISARWPKKNTSLK